jgi:hypothetical protein
MKRFIAVGSFDGDRVFKTGDGAVFENEIRALATDDKPVWFDTVVVDINISLGDADFTAVRSVEIDRISIYKIIIGEGGCRGRGGEVLVAVEVCFGIGVGLVRPKMGCWCFLQCRQKPSRLPVHQEKPFRWYSSR